MTASSKDTPCSLTFFAAFRGSQENCKHLPFYLVIRENQTQMSCEEMPGSSNTPRELHADPSPFLRPCDQHKAELRAANVLPLTRARPVRSGSATHSVARTEPRKRRASEQPRIGCCGELAGWQAK